MLKRSLTRLRRSIRKRRGSQSSPFSVMPIEILHIIFHFISLQEEPQKSLLNLALTCRIFCVLARQYIPKNVEFFAHSTEIAFKLFERSVTKDASYAENVRSLIFKKLPEEKECDIEAEQIRRLLNCLPKLKTLNLDGLPYDHIVPTLFSQPLDLKSTLGKLDIPGGLNVTEVAELLSFPSIRTWRFWKLDDFECYDRFPEVEDIYLRELRFENCQIGLPLFKNTISRCRNLQILECNLPFHAPVQGHSHNHEVTIETVFPALELQSILPAAVKTLKRLYLHSNGQTWQKWNDIRLDLSMFSELKDVELSAMCVFAPIARDLPREGLYNVLPRCIELFKVRLNLIVSLSSSNNLVQLHFPPNIGLFYSTVDGRINAEEYSHFLLQGLTSSDSHWIHELALQKASRLPNLNQVFLLEEIQGPGGQIYDSYSWLVPSWLKAAFEEAQISLFVNLRRNIAS